MHNLLVFIDGNSQPGMWLLAAVQLASTKLCVVLQDRGPPLSEMDRWREEWGMKGEVKRMDRRWCGERGGVKVGVLPNKTDATTMAVVLWDINRLLIDSSHIVPNLLELAVPPMLCYHSMLASK